MILRRIAESIRRQDWFTVALEVVIVVLGVFIGIRVANWNESLAFDRRERAYLAQLKDEVAQNRRVTEYQIAYVDGSSRPASGRSTSWKASGPVRTIAPIYSSISSTPLR